MTGEPSASPLADRDEIQSQADDGTLNELPLLRRERIWSFRDYSAVNIGLAIATWAFLQGGAVAYYVGAKHAIASIVIGYGISCLLVALAPCLPSARWGVEQFVSLRSIFGTRGARILMLVMSAVMAAAWSAVLAIMCGHAVANVSNEVFGTSIAPSAGIVSVLGLAAVAVAWGIVAKGAWWPNVGNLARLTQNSRAAYWPNVIGLFGASVVAAIVGVFAALALNSEDPTVWMVPLGGVVLGVLALAFVGLANITSVVAQSYSALVAIRGGCGEAVRRTPWALLAALILVPAAVLVFFPSTVYDNYARFVSWGAILVAPLCGIQLVDYSVLRRQQLSLRDLYLPDPRSAYWFWRGYNPAGITALVAGSLTYALLLNPVTYEPAGWFRWMTASIPAFVVAATLHYVLTRLLVARTSMGAYRS